MLEIQTMADKNSLSLNLSDFKKIIIAACAYSKDQSLPRTESKPKVEITVWGETVDQFQEVEYSIREKVLTRMGTKTTSLSCLMNTTHFLALCLTKAVLDNHGKEAKVSEYFMENLKISKTEPKDDEDFFLSFELVEKKKETALNA
jgi:hypothetical protein